MSISAKEEREAQVRNPIRIFRKFVYLFLHGILQEWIEEITGDALDGGTLAESLKDGIVLCRCELLHWLLLSSRLCTHVRVGMQIGQ
jgi:hypothetical protein